VTVRRVVPNVKTDAFEENREFYRDSLGFKIGMDMGWIMTFVVAEPPDSPGDRTEERSIGIPS